MINKIIEEFQLIQSVYWNSSGYDVLYILSLLYVLFSKHETKNRKSLGWYSLLILVIIYNPLFLYVAYQLLGAVQVYVRVFYTLPIMFLIAYVCVKLVYRINTNGKKILLAVCLIMVIIYSGRSIYKIGSFTNAENIYKLPQEVIQVCDIIGEKGESKAKAIVPNELLNYIRQYDASIELPYGRYFSESETALGFTNGEFDITIMMEYIKENQCNYIVYYRDKEQIVNQFVEYGYKQQGTTDKYIVLKKTFD